jgi:hypothetical protein
MMVSRALKKYFEYGLPVLLVSIVFQMKTVFYCMVCCF